MCMYVWQLNGGACKGQKRALDSLVLDLQVVANCLIWMVELNLDCLQRVFSPMLCVLFQ